MSEDRFQVVYTQKAFAMSTSILLDTETGVRYLQQYVGLNVALTPLLDADGKPAKN